MVDPLVRRDRFQALRPAAHRHEAGRRGDIFQTCVDEEHDGVSRRVGHLGEQRQHRPAHDVLRADHDVAPDARL